MFTLPDGYVSKFSDESQTHVIDPSKCSDQEFKEVIIYCAFMSQTQIKLLKEEVSGLKEDVTDLQTAMTAKDGEISDLREENKDLRSKFAKLEEDFGFLKSDVKLQSEQVLHLERYTREWGLRFGNIKEDTDENCVQIIEKLLAKVGMPHVKIENAHRIGVKSDDGPRMIAARCHSRPERREVLHNRKKLFELGVPTFESLCKYDADLKKRYGPVMTRLYNEGKRVYFAKGQLMVNGRKYAGPPPPPLPARSARVQRTHSSHPPVTVTLD